MTLIKIVPAGNFVTRYWDLHPAMAIGVRMLSFPSLPLGKGMVITAANAFSSVPEWSAAGWRPNLPACFCWPELSSRIVTC